MTAFTVKHVTRYEYEFPVTQAQHVAHLRPRRTEYQQVSLTDIESRPRAGSTRARLDYFGNFADSIEVREVHKVFEVSARSVVVLHKRPHVISPPETPAWESVAALIRDARQHLNELEFSLESPLVPGHESLLEYALPSFTKGRPIFEAVQDLNDRIHNDFAYDPAATDVSTPLASVVKERRGVCQDFAHVAIGCLRSLGLAGRYVSGYLETLPPPGMPRLVGADASHAWAAVFIPDLGWVDFDPTNNSLPNDQHITVAWGRDFSDVSPLRGTVLGSGEHMFFVSVDVERRTTNMPAAV